MSKTKGNNGLDAFSKPLADIDTASEVSQATLVALIEYSESETVRWTIAGVLDQIAKIQESVELIYKARRGRKA